MSGGLVVFIITTNDLIDSTLVTEAQERDGERCTRPSRNEETPQENPLSTTFIVEILFYIDTEKARNRERLMVLCGKQWYYGRYQNRNWRTDTHPRPDWLHWQKSTFIFDPLILLPFPLVLAFHDLRWGGPLSALHKAAHAVVRTSNGYLLLARCLRIVDVGTSVLWQRKGKKE